MAFDCSMVLSPLLEYSVREGKLSPPGKFGSAAVALCKNVGPEFNDDCGTQPICFSWDSCTGMGL